MKSCKRKSGSSSFPEAKRNPLEHKLTEFKTLIECKETVAQGLTCFIKAAQDKAIETEFVDTYLVQSPDCKELTSVLDDQISSQELQLVFECLEFCLLHCGSVSGAFKNTGMQLARKLLLGFEKRLYYGLNSRSYALVKATLRILSAMVAQGVTVAREMLQTFDFTVLAPETWTNRRNVKKTEHVRMCYVRFCLSFLISGDAAVISKAMETKGLLSSVFKGMPLDSIEVVYLFLSMLRQQVVNNKAVTKKAKVSFFSSYALRQIAQLFGRHEEEIEIMESDGSDGTKLTPLRQFVHYFLTELCCSQQTGIVFPCRQPVYPGRTNNPILLHFIDGLSAPWGDPLLSDLVVNILTTCPDLVHPYFGQSSLTLEPRYSQPWFSLVQFLLQVLTKTTSHLSVITATVPYNPYKLAQHVKSLVSPPLVSRGAFTRGLQHKVEVVRYASLLLLSVILDKVLEVKMACDRVATEDSRWRESTVGSSEEGTFLCAFLGEIWKVLPDVNILISACHKASPTLAAASSGNVLKPESLQSAEAVCLTLDMAVYPVQLTARILKTMINYQCLFADTFVRIGYDPGKLIQDSRLLAGGSLIQCLVLELLLYAQAETWIVAGSSDVLMSVLELVLSATEKVSVTALTVLKKMLLQTGLFDYNPNEVSIWLDELSYLRMYQRKDTMPYMLLWLGQVIVETARDPTRATDEMLAVQSEIQATDTTDMSQSVNSKMTIDLNAIMESEDVFEELTTEGVSGLCSSLPFTPLLVAALHQYSSAIKKALDGEETILKALWSLATFVGSVVLSTFHSVPNMAALGHLITDYYSSPFLSETSTSRIQIEFLQSKCSSFYAQHLHVCHYVSCWMSTPNQLVCQPDVSVGRAMIKAVMSDPQRQDIHEVLSFLSKDEFQDVLAELLTVCQQKGDLSPVSFYIHTHPGILAGATDVNNDVLEELACGMSKASMLVAVSVQWTQESNSVAVQLPDPYRQDVLLNVSAKQTVHSLHQVAYTIINLLSRMALHMSNVGHFLFLFASCSSPSHFNQLLLSLQQNVDMHSVSTCTFHLKLLTNTLEQLRECDGGNISLRLVLEALTENKAIIDLVSVCMKPNTSKKKRTKRLTKSAGLQLNEVQATLACEFANILDITKPICCSNLPLEKSVQQLAGKLMDLVLTSDLKNTERVKLLSQLSQHISEQDINTLTEHLLKGSLDGTESRIDHTDCLVALLSVRKSNMSSAEFKAILDLAIKRRDHASNEAAQTLQAAVEDYTFFNRASIDYSLLVDKRSFESLLNCHMTTDIAGLCAVLVRYNPILGRQFGELLCNELLSSRESQEQQLMKMSKLDLLPVVCAYFDQTGNLDDKVTHLLIKTYWPVITDQLLGSSCDTIQHLCSHLLSSVLLFMQTRSKHSKMKLKLLESLCSSISSQHVFKSAEKLAASLLASSLLDGPVAFVATCLTLLFDFWNNDTGQQYDIPTEDEVIGTLGMWTENLSGVSDKGLLARPRLSSAWNNFIRMSLRKRFCNGAVLKLMSSLIRLLYKGGDSQADAIPLSSLYKRIVSHSQFFPTLLEKGEADDTRVALLELIYHIVERCPTTRSTETALLCLVAYSPHLSVHDQLLLKLMAECENSGAQLRNASPYLWGKRALELVNLQHEGVTSLYTRPGPQEVLEQLNPSTLTRSAVKFPIRRMLSMPLGRTQADGMMPDLYDPCFLLPLFSHIFQPGFKVSCRKFIELGGFAFVVSSLASVDDHMRAAGYHVLWEYSSHLDTDQFREKSQIQRLLEALANAVTQPNLRIPFISACFLAKASQILLKPEHPMYGHVNKALTVRPAFDLSNIPIFYELFNSSSLEYKTEQKWMLQLLCDGLRDENDYRIYRKRHVMELAMSFHSSPLSDRATQDAVFELVKRGCTVRKAAVDLCRKHGLLAWCHGVVLSRDQKWDKITKVVSIMACLVKTFEETGHMAYSSMHESLLLCTTILGQLSNKTSSFESLLTDLLQVLQKIINLADSIDSLPTASLMGLLLDKSSLLLTKGQLHTAGMRTSVLVGHILSLLLHWRQPGCSGTLRVLEMFRKCCLMMKSFDLEVEYSSQIAHWLLQHLQHNKKLVESVLQEEDSFMVNTIREFVLKGQWQQGLQDLSNTAVSVLKILTECLLSTDLNDEVLPTKCRQVKLLLESTCYKTLVGNISKEDNESHTESTILLFRHLWSEMDPGHFEEQVFRT